jgi:ribosome-associated protein
MPIPLSRKKPRLKPEKPTLLALAEKALDDGKAEDVVTIDLAGKSTIADQMLIATGRSQRQVAALAERIIAAMKEGGYRPSVEGLRAGDWVLIDAGDVIIHIFRPEVRDFYNLEKMWGAVFAEPGAAAP